MAATFTSPFYIEQDEFTTDRVAGSVDGTDPEPVQPVSYLLLNGLPWDIGNGDLMVESA